MDSAGDSGHLTRVQDLVNILPAHELEVDHGGFQIAVTKPFLKSSNADAMLKAGGRKGVAEFVKVPLLAMWSFGALIAVS